VGANVPTQRLSFIQAMDAHGDTSASPLLPWHVELLRRYAAGQMFGSCLPRARLVVSRFLPAGMGWRRDLPDYRDYTYAHPQLRAALDNIPRRSANLPVAVDFANSSAIARTRKA